MSAGRRTISVALGILAALTAVVAVTYLVVACQSLPGLLGPVAGDTHPRTKLGAVFLVLAVLLTAAWVAITRRSGGRGADHQPSP